jgi:hypothetical protein
VTLSACVAGRSPAWIRFIFELMRPLSDELVAAIDSRVPEEELGQLDGLADRLFRFDYADPPERVAAWLHAQCSGDWLLRLDDDEVPSRDFLDSVRELAQNRTYTHYWIQRRWLFPTPETYLDQYPWLPNNDLRLVRNDPRFFNFSGVMHITVEAEGPGAWLETPIYHLDLLVNDRAARAAKAARYERLRPGLRIAGRALNEAFYLPETRPDARLAQVPPADFALIERMLSVPRSGTGSSSISVPLATREEIDRFWKDRSWPESLERGRVEVVSAVEPLAAGERKLVDARVHNLGIETWPWGKLARPPIRVGYHWYSATGEVVDYAGTWTPLPADLAPGEACLVPLSVDAPSEPGDYLFQVELVHEGVRWFGAGPRLEVRVSPQPRLALLAHETRLADLLHEFALERADYEVVAVGAMSTLDLIKELRRSEALLIDAAPMLGRRKAVAVLAARLLGRRVERLTVRAAR